MTCPRSQALEDRLARAESLLLDAAWAFRHLACGNDQQAVAYEIALAVQTYETGWHERRQSGEVLAACAA